MRILRSSVNLTMKDWRYRNGGCGLFYYLSTVVWIYSSVNYQ